MLTLNFSLSTGLHSMPSVSTCTTPSAPHVYRLGDTKSNNI